MQWVPVSMLLSIIKSVQDLWNIVEMFRGFNQVVWAASQVVAARNFAVRKFLPVKDFLDHASYECARLRIIAKLAVLWMRVSSWLYCAAGHRPTELKCKVPT